MESRLLSLKEFANYAGKISRNSARKLAGISGAEVQYGRRVLVDRLRFDEWVDRQNSRTEN